MAKGFVIPSIFTAVDKLTGPLTKMSAKMREFEKSTKGIRLKEIGEVASKVARTAAIAGLAIAAPLALAARETMKYEDSLASFRTIVSDLSDNDFAKFKTSIEDVGKETKKSFTEVAASYEKIAGLNATFAETAEGIAAVSKASIILARASKQDLGSSAENLVGIMNQFSMGALESNRAINALAAGQAVGAASIKQTAEAFVNFGATAYGANITLEQSVALVQTLGKFSLVGAEAGTKLRGAISKLQQSGVGYKNGVFNINSALEETKAKFDKLKTAKQKDAYLDKVFGEMNITAGRILLGNIGTFQDFTKAVTGTDEAKKAAAINTNTLSERLKAARANIENLSIKIGEKLVPSLTKLVDKITPVIEKIIDWVDRNPELTKTIVKVAVVVGGLAGGISLLAWAISLWTKAQLILNVVLSANPIGLIIIGVAFLIGLIAVIINKWNDWGAALSVFLGPLGMIISLIQSFGRNWDGIVKAFKEGGIIAGLKKIGATLLDALIQPMQQLISWVGKITGWDWAEGAANRIQELRKSLGVNVTTDESGNPLPEKPAVNSKAVQQDASVQRTESVNNAKVNISLKDPLGRLSAETDNKFVRIITSSTMPAYSGAGGTW